MIVNNDRFINTHDNIIMGKSKMVVEKWLESLRSKSTRNVYLSGLRGFTKIIFGDVELEKTLQNYLTEIGKGRDPFKDLLAYATSLADRPPKTANSYIHGVINFLEHTAEFELTRKQRRTLRNKLPRGRRARTIEEDLTRDRLRKILTHCDTKGMTLFLFLENSGIRVGEALQLELDDIDLKSEPIKVNVRGEYAKTGDPYYSFIGQEAKESLTEWLKVRGQYLLSSAKRGRGLAKTGDGRGVKPIEDNRIFPFSFSVATSMWNIALRRAGLENHDKGTNRRTLHIHMLRKYFNSKLKLVVPREIVEALMGQEEGLSDAYRRYSEQEIRDWYLKGEPHLYVFVPQEISKIQTHFKGELQELKDKVNDMLYQNQKLLIDRDELRSKIEHLSQTVGNLTENFTKNVEVVAQSIYQRWLRQHYEDERKAIKELEDYRKSGKWKKDVKQKE